MAGNGNGEVQPAYEMMERQVSQMVRLIDDLLDVSRITRGKIELKRERLDLNSLVQHAAEAGRQACEKMGHELHVSLPTEAVHIYADPTRIAQVVGNLLTNACKFTESGGKIWVSLERNDSNAVLRVRDTGSGISSDHLGEIFQMFTQLESTLERSQGGLGIGLSLTKSLVEMHGGNIEAHSPGVGRGSEFVVRLPAATDKSNVRLETRDMSKHVRFASRNILVVDDNHDSAESLAMLLKLVGNKVSTAHDGQEAFQAAEKVRPDAILLDIGLPKLNGYEACRKIREQSWGKVIKIIALTGWGQDDDRRKSKEAGFDGHLVKPVEHTALQKLLNDLLPT
jgi:CheY-like chemotaxis protein